MKTITIVGTLSTQKENSTMLAPNNRVKKTRIERIRERITEYPTLAVFIVILLLVAAVFALSWRWQVKHPASRAAVTAAKPNPTQAKAPVPTPAAATPAQPPKVKTYYRVKHGDVLSQIARAYFRNGGTEPVYKAVAAEAGISNPDHIYVGQVIPIPFEITVKYKAHDPRRPRNLTASNDEEVLAVRTAPPILETHVLVYATPEKLAVKPRLLNVSAPATESLRQSEEGAMFNSLLSTEGHQAMEMVRDSRSMDAIRNDVLPKEETPAVAPKDQSQPTAEPSTAQPIGDPKNISYEMPLSGKMVFAESIVPGRPTLSDRPLITPDPLEEVKEVNAVPSQIIAYEFFAFPGQIHGIKTGIFPAYFLKQKSKKNAWKERQAIPVLVRQNGAGTFIFDMPLHEPPSSHSALAMDLGGNNILDLGGVALLQQGKVLYHPIQTLTIRHRKKAYATLNRLFPEEESRVKVFARMFFPIGIGTGAGFAVGGPIGALAAGPGRAITQLGMHKLQEAWQSPETQTPPEVQYVIGSQADELQSLSTKVETLTKTSARANDLAAIRKELQEIRERLNATITAATSGNSPKENQ